MEGQRISESRLWRLTLTLSLGVGISFPLGLPAWAGRGSSPGHVTVKAQRMVGRGIGVRYQMPSRPVAAESSVIAVGRSSRAAVRGIAVQPAPQEELHILSPAEGARVNKHELGVGPGIVSMTWNGIASARSYAVSVFDSTEHAYIARSALAGDVREYALRDSVIAYGHQYVLSVTATEMTSPIPESTVTDTVEFVVPILPELSDPLDQRLDQGQIVWDGCTPELIAARDELARRLADRGWSIRYTSAYRSLTYQEHLYLVADTPRRGTQPADISRLRVERLHHQLSHTVARPASVDSHVRGVAFDAVVTDEHGHVRNSREWRDRRVEAMATASGLSMLPAGLNDSVHFGLA